METHPLIDGDANYRSTKRLLEVDRNPTDKFVEDVYDWFDDETFTLRYAPGLAGEVFPLRDIDTDTEVGNFTVHSHHSRYSFDFHLSAEVPEDIHLFDLPEFDNPRLQTVEDDDKLLTVDMCIQRTQVGKYQWNTSLAIDCQTANGVEIQKIDASDTHLLAKLYSHLLASSVISPAEDS